MKTFLISITILITNLLFTQTATASTSVNMLAPPVNDLIENAIDLDQGPFPYSELAVNFPEATNTNDPTGNPSCDLVHPGVWYKFTATSTGVIAALMVNPSNSWIIIFSAPDENVTDGSELTHVDVPTNSCGSGNSKTIETIPGTTYYIYMKNSAPSDVLININPALVPSNDLIENAADLNELSIILDNNSFVLDNLQFQFATNTNDGNQNGCNTDDMQGIWFKLYSYNVGEISSQLGFNPSDSVIITYSAANGNATQGSDLTYIDTADNTCGFSNFSRLVTEPNTYYYIFVYSQHDINDILFNLDEDVLAVKEKSIESFKYYPNPIKNEINLSAKTTIDQVSIFNLLGQSVYSEKINNTKSSINLSSLQKGMYIMTVTAEGNTASYKIIKE